MDLARVEVAWSDGVAVARVKGEIDLSNAGNLVSSLASAVEEAPLVVLDLSELSFIGSSGIHALFQLSRLCSRFGGAMCVVAPEISPLRSILLLTDLSKVVPLHDTVPLALEQNGHLPRPS